MSADRCLVCGCDKWDNVYQCLECAGDGCENAARLAIERAAEIERLKLIIQELEAKPNKGD